MVKKSGKELPERKLTGRGKQSSGNRSQRNIPHSPNIHLEEVNFTKLLQTLQPHDHLCLIYESPEEWRAAAVPFIAIGLKRGEKCLYVADTSTADEIRKYLAEEVIDVASTEKSGQLSILRQAEAYTRKGFFDPDSMIALLTKETEKAVAEGYPALRVTGEMTWVLRGHPGSERLLEYEAKLNRDFFPYYPCFAICQYDRWKFDSEVIKGVIMTHPLLVRGNHIYHNFYYIPPEEFLDRQRADLEVEHWLSNLEREQQIQETLRQSEEKLRIIIESIPEGVTVSDLNANILQINNAVLHLHGYDRQELIGRSVLTLIAGEDHARAMDNLKKTLKTGRSGTLEYTFARSDGSTFPAELSAALLKDRAGKPIGFVAVTKDITERKRAKEALEKSEERYRQLANNAGEAIIVIQDGVIKFTNPKAAELSGYSIEELISTPFVKFVHPDDSDMVAARYVRRLKGESVPQIYEFRIIRKDGEIRWGELNAVRISWDHRPAVLCFIDDITDRKKTQEKLILTDRLASIGQLASGMAHELNNPLTSIIGFSEMLAGRDFPENIKEDLAIINREARRAANIVNGLLAFTREQATEKTLLDINSIIQWVLQLRSYEQRARNIEVDARFAPDLPRVMGSGIQLQQVFVNIIINAELAIVEAHGRGKLTITTEQVDDMVRASIADDGPGISPDDMKRLFTPFFTTRKVGEGTGLGLSICHGIVTEHGGRIYAESELGKGATFVVELPTAR